MILILNFCVFIILNLFVCYIDALATTPSHSSSDIDLSQSPVIITPSTTNIAASLPFTPITTQYLLDQEDSIKDQETKNDEDNKDKVKESGTPSQKDKEHENEEETKSDTDKDKDNINDDEMNEAKEQKEEKGNESKDDETEETEETDKDIPTSIDTSMATEDPNEADVDTGNEDETGNKKSGKKKDKKSRNSSKEKRRNAKGNIPVSSPTPPSLIERKVIKQKKT